MARCRDPARHPKRATLRRRRQATRPTATKPEHWSVNREGTVHLTVVTADYNKLG